MVDREAQIIIEDKIRWPYYGESKIKQLPCECLDFELLSS